MWTFVCRNFASSWMSLILGEVVASISSAMVKYICFFVPYLPTIRTKCLSKSNFFLKINCICWICTNLFYIYIYIYIYPEDNESTFSFNGTTLITKIEASLTLCAFIGSWNRKWNERGNETGIETHKIWYVFSKCTIIYTIFIAYKILLCNNVAVFNAYFIGRQIIQIPTQ